MAELGPVWLAVAVLAATVAIAVVAGRTTIPASVGLVLLGLAVAVLGPGVVPAIPPELLLAIVLPGLVFEAAFRTDLELLRPTALPILVLAVPGVVVVAGIVAAILSATTGLSLAEGFLVGAMVAATDPAAVLSTFRHVHVPARLATMVEMESLVNDGTGIVLFALAIEILGGGGSLGGSLLAFVVRVAGGGLLGAAAGWLGATLVRRVDDHLAELTLTVVLAYGAYLVAESAGLSGVIATLFAAGVFGASARGALTERAVDAIDVVWEFVAFLLTAGVFLLVGLSIAPSALGQAAGSIAWGIVAILLARAIVVFGLLGGGSSLLARIRPAPPANPSDEEAPAAGWLGRPWLVVLFWAGLRGAVSVALALSVPASLPNRELIQGLTYGIVLFTLLVQGTTTAWVVRRSGAATPAESVPAT
ncbi:MAG TPA: cation:proton antiporter [Candidatus Limnocylindrales bacterium]|nr:cation:proton antiporter [Candidatus Limnocylindrales bacterium]